MGRMAAWVSGDPFFLYENTLSIELIFFQLALVAEFKRLLPLPVGFNRLTYIDCTKERLNTSRNV